MRLVETSGELRIEGAGCERAQVAHAVLNGDDVIYELERSERRSLCLHIRALGSPAHGSAALDGRAEGSTRSPSPTDPEPEPFLDGS